MLKQLKYILNYIVHKARKIHVCARVNVYAHAHVCSHPQAPKAGIGCLAAIVMGGCELSDMGEASTLNH